MTDEKFVTVDGASRQDSVQHHLDTLADRLKAAYHLVRENKGTGRETQMKYYDRRTKLVTFQQEILYI